jgi:hypothetical protein
VGISSAGCLSSFSQALRAVAAPVEVLFTHSIVWKTLIST